MEDTKKKKPLLENGTWLTNGAKIFSVLVAIGYNVAYLITQKKAPSWEEQKSVLAMCVFIVVIFSPIDISLIVNNIFKK